MTAGTRYTVALILVYDQKPKPLQTSEMGRLFLLKNKLAIERERKNPKGI